MTLTAKILARFAWNWSDGATDNTKLEVDKNLSLGPEQSQAQAVWHVEDEVLLSGNSVTLDLTALVRTVLGASLTTALVGVRGILIYSSDASVGTLLVGASGGNEWHDPFATSGQALSIPPDGAAMVAAPLLGWPVDGSHKLLKLKASGGDVTYSIAIIGTTSSSSSSGA